MDIDLYSLGRLIVTIAGIALVCLALVGLLFLPSHRSIDE